MSSVYEGVVVEKYVIMPNHIHLITDIHPKGGQMQNAPTLSRIIKQFKGAVTKKIGYAIWQKSFYDQIIHNEEEYTSIWHYIDKNPSHWQEDYYFMENKQKNMNRS